MSELNQGELLAWLNIWVRRWSMMSGKEKQAYQQIREMIQKPGVTEEWVEEKAKKLITMVSSLYPHEGNPCVIPKNKAKDFIRSLVEKI